MKKGILTSLFLVFMISLFAQQNETIKLNQPSKERGLTVIQALAERASVREFDTRPLALQDLSDLLWAANGINRPEGNLRTASSAVNAQDVDVYVFLEEGVYIYNAQDHALDMVVRGDQRSILPATDGASYPPLICLLVSDISRFGVGTDELKIGWGAIDSGIVAQNILLFATSIDMMGRPRASMDLEVVKRTLNLSDTQYPMLNIPVSYKK